MNMIQTPSGEAASRTAPAPVKPAHHQDAGPRRRRLIRVGSATTAVAVAAQTLGHVQALSHFCIDAVHWSIFRNVDMLLRVGVPIAVFGGIALAIYGFVFHAKDRRTEHTLALAALALIVTSSAAYASLKLLPKPVTVNDYVSVEASERTKRLLAYEVTNDGYGWYYNHYHHMHVSYDSPSPSPPWAPLRPTKWRARESRARP